MKTQGEQQHKRLLKLAKLALNSEGVNEGWKESIVTAIGESEGIWYKGSYGSEYMMYATKIKALQIKEGYGTLDDGKWIVVEEESVLCAIVSANPATDEEITEFFLKEAKKRGFVEGTIFQNAWSGNIHGEFTGEVGTLNIAFGSLQGIHSGNQWILHNGKWADILETISKAEAEKALGKRIE
jgi:hypothetical protein